MRSLKLLPLLCLCACNPFASDSKEAAGPAATASQTQPATQTAAAAASGTAGAEAPTSPFGIMSMIIPPSMPFMGGAKMTGMTGMTGTGTSASGVAGAGAVPPGAGAAAPGQADASGQAADPFDPATFDEAHGRSRGTAPLGTPVEMGGMECPNEVCKPLPALPDQAAMAGATISLCCTDAGECGTKGSGPMSMGDPNECHIIPDSDPQCARLDLMGFEIASCCTADGKCGLNGQNFMMMPCGSIEDAMAKFGGFIELPPPAPCEPGKGPPLSSSAPAPGMPTGTATDTSMTAAAGSGAAMTGAAGTTGMTMSAAGGGAVASGAAGAIATASSMGSMGSMGTAGSAP